MKDKDSALRLLKSLVPDEYLCEDGVGRTPERMTNALEEMLEGYKTDPSSVLNTAFPRGSYDQIVVVKEIPFSSLCEHHVLPFIGTASIGYLPDKTLIGLSKIPRLVKVLSRRLQIQERLTEQIAIHLQLALKAKGVAVVMEAHHSCMSLRGACSAGKMVTSAMLGAFRDSLEAKSEVLSLMGI